MKKAWLQDVDWSLIVDINRELCVAKSALHKGTQDGFDEARFLWQEHHEKATRLMDAVELCRRCHRLAPFCNYNGNTFVAVIRNVINATAVFSPAQKALARSLAGHLVAGTAEPEEEAQFKDLLNSLGV